MTARFRSSGRGRCTRARVSGPASGSVCRAIVSSSGHQTQSYPGFLTSPTGRIIRAHLPHREPQERRVRHARTSFGARRARRPPHPRPSRHAPGCGRRRHLQPVRGIPRPRARPRARRRWPRCTRRSVRSESRGPRGRRTARHLRLRARQRRRRAPLLRGIRARIGRRRRGRDRGPGAPRARAGARRGHHDPRPRTALPARLADVAQGEERDRHRQRGPFARAPRARPRLQPRDRLVGRSGAARRHRQLRRRIARRAARPRRHQVRVYSPSGRAAGFAASHDIEAVSDADFAFAAAAADVIVTCTTADHQVVDRVLLEGGRAMLIDAHRTGSVLAHSAWCPSPSAAADARQLVIDLGMPRNVAPDVVEVPGVELLDLETIRIHAPLEELGATDAARELVGQARAQLPRGPQRRRRHADRRGPAPARHRHPRRRDRPGPLAWRRRRTHRGRPSAHGRGAAAQAHGALARARAGRRAACVDRRGRRGVRRAPPRPRRRCATGRRRMPPGAARAPSQADAS